MTQIEVRYDIEAMTFSLIALGHSGYDVMGKDIVCASISSLTQFFASLESASGRLLDMTKFNGSLGLKTKITDENTLVIDILTECLMDIAQQYPSYVSFKVLDE